LNYSDLNTFAGIKNKKYLHTTFFEITLLRQFIANFSSFLDLRLTLSNRAESILALDLSAWTLDKLDKLVEDDHLLLGSKPLEGDFCCLENIDF
jgi:hypothetical protein